MSISDFIEGKINDYAEKIVHHSDKADELAMGELTFYMAMRRVAEGHGTTQDLGMMDAINDTLQELGVLEKGKTFYK
jgi:hypothetical protein